MDHASIGFIGGGRIVRILLSGWQRAGVQLPTVVVSEPDDAAFERLQNSASGVSLVRGDSAAAGRQSVVFLAVHPPLIVEVGMQIAGAVSPEAMVVSLAPKVTLDMLRDALSGFTRLVRMIPNAPSIVGQGFNPLAWGAELGAADKEAFRSLMRPLGQLPEVNEETLETYAILSAMGPTYFWPQWLELESLGEEFGLSAERARQAVRAMTAGALATLDSSLSTEEVLDLIPVKPLAEFERTLCETYRERLRALSQRLRPAVMSSKP